MFKYIHKLSQSVRVQGNRRSNISKEDSSGNGISKEMQVSSILDENLSLMNELFREDSDFVVRKFVIPISGGIEAAAFYIDGLVSAQNVNEGILKPLMLESRKISFNDDVVLNRIQDIVDMFLISGEAKVERGINKLLEACLMGDTLLFVDGMEEAVYFNTKGFEKRAVTEPQTETSIRGPKEGFTEVLRVNSSLIRRKIKTTDLRMETMAIGKRTNTLVSLTYIESLANPEMVKEVKRRLSTIETDAILNCGYIESYIEDSPYSPFQTISYTEKPDVVAANLLEGRCAIITDGTPFVLVMPMLFIQYFQSPEDYTIRSYFASFLRILRVISFFISLTGPALYVALTSFHQELIPISLLFTMAVSSEGVPFNAIVETVIMLITFELLKEAGVRLPKPIGQTISIVGALVMGQAAIQAGIVGPPIVIVIALTAVTSFAVPNVSDATTILRWYILILASFLGGFGIVIGLITIFVHLSALESFGVPFLNPISPLDPEGLKDAAIRAPIWSLKTRPKALRTQDGIRHRMSKPEFGHDADGLGDEGL